jgi:ElaB/YqjD/DUF883 family membrane-anchored ribosome-binding protein
MTMMKTRYATPQDELRNSASDVEDLLDDATERGRSSLRNVQERAARALDDARERLASTQSQVRRTARHAAEATDDYINEQPWRALGLGAAAGVLLGLAVGVLVATARRR